MEVTYCHAEYGMHLTTNDFKEPGSVLNWPKAPMAPYGTSYFHCFDAFLVDWLGPQHWQGCQSSSSLDR